MGSTTDELNLKMVKLKWMRTDAVAQKIIVTSVSEKVLLTLVSCKTAAELLDRLDALYEKRANQSLHLLEKQFFAATFDPEDGIAGHISRLENLANEITFLEENISQRMVINKILNTLPEEYRHFHSAWDSIME